MATSLEFQCTLASGPPIAAIANRDRTQESASENCEVGTAPIRSDIRDFREAQCPQGQKEMRARPFLALGWKVGNDSALYALEFGTNSVQLRERKNGFLASKRQQMKHLDFLILLESRRSVVQKPRQAFSPGRKTHFPKWLASKSIEELSPRGNLNRGAFATTSDRAFIRI